LVLGKLSGSARVAHGPLIRCSWAGYTFSRKLDLKKYQPVIVSPRSYFVFTPLVASTAVGTLEFRTAIEPVRARNAGVEFFQGWTDNVNFSQKQLKVEESAIADQQGVALNAGLNTDAKRKAARKKGSLFDLEYDKLVVAVGCYSQTFGTKGVKENALFLKDVGDARKIRKRVLDCFECAALPSTSAESRKQLLNFAIVGGGPTGVEFAAELQDLCNEDLKRLYPKLVKEVRITIYDVAEKILSMFDEKLAEYAVNLFKRDGIKVKTSHHIEELREGLPGGAGEEKCGATGFTLKTKEDGDIGIGMCVWSTGLYSTTHSFRAPRGDWPQSLHSVTYPVTLLFTQKRPILMTINRAHDESICCQSTRRCPHLPKRISKTAGVHLATP
jgi:NADH dehydrogenase FAD-containing subunit